MAHKRRISPLREYRAVQREIRALFDPFTQKHCAACTTPCCVEPTRVTPLDVALAQSIGHSWPHLEDRDAAAPAFAYAESRLRPLPMAQDTDIQTPCQYLFKGRCTFPEDLRPFGCTTFLCGPMHAHLPPEQIKRMRGLVRRLEESHAALLRVLKAQG